MIVSCVATVAIANVVTAVTTGATTAASAVTTAVAAVAAKTLTIEKALTAVFSAFVFLDLFYESFTQTRHAPKASTQHVEAKTPP